MLSIVAKGYSLEWNEKGQPDACDLPNGPNCEPHHEFVSESIATVLKMGAMRTRLRHQAKCIMPLDVAIRKINGKLRLIFDARWINQHMPELKIKFETLHREGRAIFDGCTCGWIVDLSFAYHHIQIPEEDWQYLCFRWDGQLYCFCVLPFGITTAPLVFTTVLKPIIGHW